jgi:hypothetical protein
MGNHTSSQNNYKPKNLKIKPEKPQKPMVMKAKMFGEALLSNKLMAEVNQYIAKVNEVMNTKSEIS